MVTPLDILRVMEGALEEYLKENKEEYPLWEEHRWQVILKSRNNPIRIRDLKSNLVSTMFVVKGIIISATKPYLKASKLKIQCKSCGNTKQIILQPGQPPYVPNYC